ncbi:hypothetical protein [Streptomyces sp. NPDC003247]|uniref:hypothetical protein n=1 Tax=Streptomyces sp. NPDC003247 TaxID=3364677 RepID=UPI00367AC07F
MRKIGKAALAAAMIGSLTMVGAGVASAADGHRTTDSGYRSDSKDTKDTKSDGATKQCVNYAEVDNSAHSSGLVNALNNVNVNILGYSSNKPTVQQSCSIGDNSTSGNLNANGQDSLLDLL